MVDSEYETWKELSRVVLLFNCNGCNFNQFVIGLNYSAAITSASCVYFLIDKRNYNISICILGMNILMVYFDSTNLFHFKNLLYQLLIISFIASIKHVFFGAAMIIILLLCLLYNPVHLILICILCGLIYKRNYSISNHHMNNLETYSKWKYAVVTWLSYLSMLGVCYYIYQIQLGYHTWIVLIEQCFMHHDICTLGENRTHDQSLLLLRPWLQYISDRLPKYIDFIINHNTLAQHSAWISAGSRSVSVNPGADIMKHTPYYYPSMGIWWYLLAQVFDDYHNYFMILLIAQPYLYLTPVMLRFQSSLEELRVEIVSIPVLILLLSVLDVSCVCLYIDKRTSSVNIIFPSGCQYVYSVHYGHIIRT